MSRKLTWRQEIVKLVSYVRYLGDDGDGQCEGYRWSSMPLKAVYDLELRETYRCKKAARWRYRYLVWRGSGKSAEVRKMCWTHLMHAGFCYGMDEEQRFDRWWRRHLAEVNAVRERHGLSPMSGEGEERHEPGAARPGDDVDGGGPA